ncbi:MAG: chromate transporter [Burkholderiales bacterium RIFCSPHIGHO2_12_FULL_69_20]|nr:MAG: chromate transporter [Burkholderiales bacterium RIFCSPHIGHO2_12_FULL_69_20]
MAETTTAPADAPDALRCPRSCGELFRVFNRLALQGFGGVLPVAHRALVERERWQSPQQFVELLTLSQVLPGPNIINMALIFGDRYLGWRGALAACAGLLLVPMFIVLVLAATYQQHADNPWVAGALRGMGAVAAGLIIATAVKLARTVGGNPLGLPLCAALGAATAVMVGWLRWPMVGVVLGLGALGTVLAWRRLRALETTAP